MNYKNIQEYVLNIKKDKDKNLNTKRLIQEYAPIRQSLKEGLPSNLHEEWDAFFNFKLYDAITKYEFKSLFNTWFVYLTRGFRKEFYRNTNSVIAHEKAERLMLIGKSFITDDSIIDHGALLDFKLDMNKILTYEEQLILYAMANGKYRNEIDRTTPCIYVVWDKLKDYFRS